MEYSTGLLDLMIKFLEGHITTEEYKISCAALCTSLRSGVFLHTGKEYSAFISDVQEARCIAALQQQYDCIESRVKSLSEAFKMAYPQEVCDSVKEAYYSLTSTLQSTENAFKDRQDDINILNTVKEDVKREMHDFELTANKLIKAFDLTSKSALRSWPVRDRYLKKHPTKIQGSKERNFSRGNIPIE